MRTSTCQSLRAMKTWTLSGSIAGFVNLILIATMTVTMLGTGITLNIKHLRPRGTSQEVHTMTSGISTITIASTLMLTLRSFHLPGRRAMMRAIVRGTMILMIATRMRKNKKKKLTGATSIKRNNVLAAMLTTALVSLLFTSSRKCSFLTRWSMR